VDIGSLPMFASPYRQSLACFRWLLHLPSKPGRLQFLLTDTEHKVTAYVYSNHIHWRRSAVLRLPSLSLPVIMPSLLAFPLWIMNSTCFFSARWKEQGQAKCELGELCNAARSQVGYNDSLENQVRNNCSVACSSATEAAGRRLGNRQRELPRYTLRALTKQIQSHVGVSQPRCIPSRPLYVPR